MTGKVLKTEYNVEAEGDNLSDDISENNIQTITEKKTNIFEYN